MKIRRAAFLSLVLASVLPLAHCAARGGQQIISNEGEHRKLLDMQKQRIEAAGRDTELKSLPAMGAKDHDRLGDRYLSQGNTVLAFIEYRKALQLDPGLVETQYKVGRLFLGRGLTEEASNSFDLMEKQQPANGLASLGKGLLSFREGDLKSAEEKFQKALTLNAGLWQAHAFLGLVCDQKKQFEKARGHYRQALRIQPRSAVVYNDLGISYYLSGDYASSADAYLKALDLDPANKKIYNNLGLALSRMGRYEEALAAFKRGNSNAGAYNNIGCVYIAERKYKEAARALERAMELSPQFYARAHDNLESLKSGGQ